VENEDALSIFFLTQGQYVMGPNGPIDINHLAVWAAIDAYGVRDRTGCFERVLNLFHHFLAENRENESV